MHILADFNIFLFHHSNDTPFVLRRYIVRSNRRHSVKIIRRLSINDEATHNGFPPNGSAIVINYGRNLVSAVLSLRESLYQEN